MTNTIEKAVLVFREHGFKITPQRREIFRIVFENSEHPTVDDVYQRALASMPDISLATVYNTMNQLNELRLVEVVRDPDESPVRYDPRPDAHDHLYCLGCGRIIDIENGNQEIPISGGKVEGFQVVRRQTTFNGYCPDCQKK